jgi:hypothetical protein
MANPIDLIVTDALQLIANIKATIAREGLLN